MFRGKSSKYVRDADIMLACIAQNKLKSDECCKAFKRIRSLMQDWRKVDGGRHIWADEAGDDPLGSDVFTAIVAAVLKFMNLPGAHAEHMKVVLPCPCMCVIVHACMRLSVHVCE